MNERWRSRDFCESCSGLGLFISFMLASTLLWILHVCLRSFLRPWSLYFFRVCVRACVRNGVADDDSQLRFASFPPTYRLFNFRFGRDGYN